MPLHRLDPTADTVVDVFSRDAPPVLTIDPGERLVVRSLDASGYLQRQAHPGQRAPRLLPDWTVLQNIQRVQFAPVDELPVAAAERAPPATPETPAYEEPTLTELASPVAATALAELYRQQELEVPILPAG